ncbi:MAG: spore coat U domain-containing protein [Achromobacter sp.]|uniref:Csu type fimbrial protein n=1 Tax=Achromobacter sp. TaxID=134375 RepID=UPI003CFCCABE
MHVRELSKTLLAAALCCLAGAVQAQTHTEETTFQVRITIQGTCLIASASDIDFGTHATASAAVFNQTGTIQVQCTKDLPFTLGLDGGTSGMPTARIMTDAVSGTTIPYTLSHDAGGASNWGNDSPSWYSGVGAGIGPEYSIPLTVYAKTTLVGNEPAGNYLDTITATVFY